MVAHLWLGLACEELAKFGETVAEFEQAARTAGRSVASLGFLGHGYASRDKRATLEAFSMS